MMKIGILSVIVFGNINTIHKPIIGTVKDPINDTTTIWMIITQYTYNCHFFRAGFSSLMP